MELIQSFLEVDCRDGNLACYITEARDAIARATGSRKTSAKGNPNARFNPGQCHACGYHAAGALRICPKCGADRYDPSNEITTHTTPANPDGVDVEAIR
jgi:predicted nucleic-acid-binding Zn-ribbon protein